MTDLLASEIFPAAVGASAAIVRLERSALVATGRDRQRFLNGMLSNDVAALAPGALQRSLLLSRKGRILAELSVAARAADHVLETAALTGPILLETLGRYIIADDVKLEPLAALRALAVEGPGAAAALVGAGLPAPASGAFDSRADELWLGGGAVTPEGVRVFAPAERLAEIAAALALPALAPAQAELLRIASFLPAYGIDMSEDNFPQEARLETSAVSFKKGCYVGQEIVARIASRGGVNKLLVQLRSAEPVEPGAEIRADGRACGRVTSAAAAPGAGGLALGYVKPPQAEPGTSLEIGATTGVVLGPPL